MVFRSESGGQSIRSGLGNASEKYDLAERRSSSPLISFCSFLRISSRADLDLSGDIPPKHCRAKAKLLI